MSGMAAMIAKETKMGHLKVRATPGARESAIGDWADGVLRVKVREPAEKGRANDAVARLLAKSLDVPLSDVSLKRGATSREKLFEVQDLEDAEIARRLGAPLL
jgi:uncharacterized protein YggU (UPF0235/DUF167 family)